MPPGSVLPPSSDDDAKKTRYVERYDKLVKDPSNPAFINYPVIMPVLNADGIPDFYPIVFDVCKLDFDFGGTKYHIAIAVVPDDIKKDYADSTTGNISETVRNNHNWKNQWKNAEGWDLIDNFEDIENGSKVKLGKKNKK